MDECGAGWNLHVCRISVLAKMNMVALSRSGGSVQIATIHRKSGMGGYALLCIDWDWTAWGDQATRTAVGRYMAARLRPHQPGPSESGRGGISASSCLLDASHGKVHLLVLSFLANRGRGPATCFGRIAIE